MNRGLGHLIVALLVAGGSFALVGNRTSAAPGESQVPAANPDLEAACGLDILVILDESGSIHDFRPVGSATTAVRQAFTGFTSALQNTGSRMAVAEFNYQGRVVTDYTEVTTATKTTLFDPYVNDAGGTSGEGYNPRPGDRTGWEDAMRIGRYFLPPPGGRPHLTVFITDGVPNNVNRVNSPSHGPDRNVTYDPGNPVVAQNEYELKQPLLQSETQSKNDVDSAAAPAIPNANALKAAGSHVLAIAVGDGLSKQGTLDTLKLVSGPDVYTGAGTFDISTTDVFRVNAFSELESSLRDAAFQLCAPSVNVQKLVDSTPDPGTDDAVPAAGWTMTADVAHPGGFTWVSPPGATGGSADVVTNAGGFANFQWTPNGTGPSTIRVTEDDTPGTGYVNDVTDTQCNYRTPDQPIDQPLALDDSGDGFFAATLPEQSIVTCTFVNRALPAPSITLEKATNGADADTAPGPSIPVGAPVTWTYRVTNTGNVTLDFAIDDVPTQTIDCGGLTSIPPGQTYECTATGTAETGQYENTATVTGTPPPPLGLPPVTDVDTSHYNGVQPGIDVEKSTNGQDADNAPGVYVPVGDNVTWEYVVTNTGPTVIDSVVLTDDQLGTITCPQTTLQPSGQAGDSMTCTGPAGQSAQAGQYSNLATVTGNAGGTSVSDSDPSHYFGETASVDVEKSTNGQDADTPTGPAVAVGDPVAWTYTITNTGNTPILDWTLTDDQLPVNAIACPLIDVIAPGQVVTCIAAAPAQLGQYANLATVDGTTTGVTQVTDNDPSHYIGVNAVLDLEKSTNGQDADAAPGVFIEDGDPVTWTYEVSMTGTDQVADVSVQDLPVQTITPVLSGGFNVGDTNQDNLLEQGETWQFTASGTATPGQYTNLAAATGTGVITGPLYAYDPSNYFGVTGGIDVEKSTNGVDADDPVDAPLIALNDPVDWNYRVLNTANSALSNVVVTDDQGVTVTCPSDTLAVGASMDCTATGTATVQGLYSNLATASGTDVAQVTHTDTDPSHYQGYLSAIVVEKSTNGQDADTPTGPFVIVGDTVTWTYTVTPGDLAVRNVVVTDDQGVTPVFVDGDANGNDELDPGETWTYEATGTAVAGQYANTATATGTDTQETPLTDTDPSHYYGIQFQANVQTTATNLAGDDHIFDIEVRYDDGTNVVEAPDGTEVEFVWTGDGAVSAVNGVAAPGATTCVTVGPFCFVTVSSSTPGSGTISVESVTASIGGSQATGTTTTTPPGLVAPATGSLTADKTWVELLVDVRTTATNVAGEPHIFTIEAFVDSGSGPALAPDGTQIDFSWSGDGAVTTVNGAAAPNATSCVTVGPFCTVTVDNDTPGTGTLTVDSVTATFGPDQVVDSSVTAIADGSLTADKTWIVFQADVQTTATNMVGDDHTFVVEVRYDDGTIVAEAPNGTEVDFTWTGDGAVTMVNGADAPGATTCVTLASFCTVTVSSTAPGSGTLDIVSVTAEVGGSTLTGDPTTTPAGLVNTANGSLSADKTWVVFQANVSFTDTNLAGDEHVFTIDAVYEDGTGQQIVPDGTSVAFTWTGGGQVTETNGNPDPNATTCLTTGGACSVTVDADTPTSGTIRLVSVTAMIGGSALTGSTTGTPPGLVPDPFTQGASLTAGKSWIEFIAKASFTSTNLLGDGHVFILDAVFEDGSGQQVVPDGSTIAFAWTGVGEVTETNGVTDVGATTCTTTGGACSVTVESAAPGAGTIEIISVTSDFGGGSVLTGMTTTTPPTLRPETGSALTADKTWVAFDVDVTPLQAVNPIGEPHTFTLAVRVDDGNGLVPLAVPPDSGTVDWSWTAPDGSTASGTCTLVAGGTCDVVRNSQVGGVGTLTATALDVVYGGVVLPTVDLTASGSGQSADLAIPVQAVKDWVGYTLTLDPPTAINLWPAAPEHVVTLSLDVFPPSLVSVAPIAGQSIDVTLASPVATITGVSDGTFTGTTAVCVTDAAGQCQVTITATGPGPASLSAVYDHDFQGQDTPIAGNDSDKTWRTYRVRVTPPNATNLLGEDHTFAVYVERSDDGSTWAPVAGARPDLTVTAPASIASQTCAAGTGGNGRCTVTVTSARPANVSVEASYEATIAGESATFTDSAAKRWIDYRVSVDPPTAENLVDSEHVVTVRVDVNRGDGAGFVPLAGAVPSISRTGVGSVSSETCSSGTRADGTCTVTIGSGSPGSTTVSASFVGRAGGESSTYRDSGVKRWIDYRISMTPERAVNALGEPHDFEALLEVDRGTGFGPASGESIRFELDGVGAVVDVTPAGPTAAACRTDRAGRCTITVNSTTAGSLTITARFSATVGASAGDYAAAAVKTWEPPTEPPKPPTNGPSLPPTGAETSDVVRMASALLALGLAAWAASWRRRRPTS